MKMPEYRMTEVDIQAMHNIAKAIETQLDQLQGDLDLSALVSRTTGFWKGQDQVAFQRLTENYVQRQQLYLLKRYRELNDILFKAADEYGKANENVKQIVSKLSR